MQAKIISLYQSEICEIKNFVCQCTGCSLSKPEYQDKFSFCYIRKGNFLFKIFRNNLDSHTGRVLLNKPGYDYRVAHIHTVPDECTIFSFTPSFYELLTERYKSNLKGFLVKRDIQSVLINSTLSIDYLHYRITELLSKRKFSNLQVDCLLMELIEKVFSIEKDSAVIKRILVKYKKNYLTKVEEAKEYIHQNFDNDITLAQIATGCSMSQFHFARTFKQIAGISPYQYLLSFRLKHSENLLKTTRLSVNDIALLSGFNTASHFSFTFAEKNNLTPTFYRELTM